MLLCAVVPLRRLRMLKGAAIVLSVVLLCLWVMDFGHMNANRSLKVTVIHRRLPDVGKGCDARLLRLMRDFELASNTVEVSYIAVNASKLRLTDGILRTCEQAIAKKMESFAMDRSAPMVPIPAAPQIQDNLNALAAKNSQEERNPKLSFFELPTTEGMPRKEQHCARMEQLTEAILNIQPDIVLLPVWFWGDELTSLAWQIVTNLRMIEYAANRDRIRPHLVAVSDDVFSARAAMLAESEPNSTESARFQEISLQLQASEEEIYKFVDNVAYITKDDLKRSTAISSHNENSRAILLRPSLPITMEIQPPTRPSFNERFGLIFLGNGGVETNYQGISWFLRKCWKSLRHRIPGITLSIVGSPPKGFAACRKRMAHCTWSTGTQYEGQEATHGIKILGYRAESELRRLLLEARLFIEPIVTSTGINTKAFHAFGASLPIVMTKAASAGFVDGVEGGYLTVGDTEPQWFVQTIHALHSNETLWTSAQIRQHKFVNALVRRKIGIQDAKHLLDSIR